MVDQLGERIERGATIAYPSRKGARMWQRIARVLTVDANGIHGLLAPSGRAVTIKKTDGVVVCRGGAL